MTTQLANHSLEEKAELALYELSLSFELQVGKRYRWRKNSNNIFEMVDEAFKSQYIELIEKAVNFFAVIPYELQHEFISRRISPPSQAQIKKQLYRGILIEQKIQATHKENNPSKKSTSSHLRYRGVTINKAKEENTEEESTEKANTNTGKKRVKRIWRGVVSYTDQ